MNHWVKKVFLIVLISLALTETLLRMFGYRPGYWGKFEGFYVVDSLVVYKNFITDEYGIYKFSSWVTDSLKRDYNWRTGMIRDNTSSQDAIIPWDKINYVYTSYSKLKYRGETDIALIAKIMLLVEGKEDWDTEFTRAYDMIRKKTEPNSWEQAIKEYVANPFNSDGFRSIAFEVHDTSRTRILLIGDSFAYGMSARPFFNSYPDILLMRGYEIYNTGIPGVDPSQYAAVAKKYVPLLKPDLVILNFSDNEDLMPFPRKAEMGKPHEHFTNAGSYFSYPLGTYLSPEEAYVYYSSLISIPNGDMQLFNKICSLSVIGSLAWGYLLKKGYREHPKLNQYFDFKSSFDTEIAIKVTANYLEVIDSICKATHVPLLNVVIPDKTADYNQETTYINIDTTTASRLFSGKYYYPKDLFKEEDYYYSEDHFNNAGSIKFADYLEGIIKETIRPE